MAIAPCSPWVPAVLFACWGLGAWVTRARLRDLPALPPDGLGGELPSIALCLPARDEAQELGPALDTWLAQDYPALRILVVDDGSSDATPAILAQRQRQHPGRLRVLRNDTLPPGWLGKNHALDLASRQPEALTAEWLLFADADVHATGDLLRRAFAFLADHPADLLTLLPGLDTVGWAERIFIPTANLGFLLMIPVQRVPDPGSAAHCGVGAFTLVRRVAYDAVGGHAAAPMEPIDDMMLAKRVKAARFTNRVALGGPGLHLRMYPSLGAILQALRKNLLAPPYLFPLAPLTALAALVATFSPLWLALLGYPWSGLFLWLLVPPLLGEVHTRYTGRPMDLAWAFWPLTGLVFAVSTLWAFSDRLRGINHWRGRDVRL